MSKRLQQVFGNISLKLMWFYRNELYLIHEFWPVLEFYQKLQIEMKIFFQRLK